MNKTNGHIFISYAREDRGRVAILAKLLVDEGWSVWLDKDNLPAGQQFHRAIEKAIQDAACVLVCWSEAAIKSDWVLGEADVAREQEKILPVLLETVKPPINFRTHHYVDLSEWDNKASHLAYQRLKAELTKNKLLIKSNVKILLDQLDIPSTDPEERLAIGDELAKLGDSRPGVGLDENRLPDIDWVEIPGGEFLYGRLKKSRKINAFNIARYPITNEQYKAFINDDGYENDRWWQGLSVKVRNSVNSNWDQSNRPREMVNWYEAIAFCRWLSDKLGYDILLPSEEQWERAARGTDGREYPWGNEYLSGYANVDEEIEKAGPHCLQQTSAVGLYPLAVSPEGVLDLAGNVWEWCLNEWSNSESTALQGDAPRALRGSSWFYGPDQPLSLVCNGYPPIYRSYDVGFRVVCSSPITH